jgi:hypothetical protein
MDGPRLRNTISATVQFTQQLRIEAARGRERLSATANEVKRGPNSTTALARCLARRSTVVPRLTTLVSRVDDAA